MVIFKTISFQIAQTNKQTCIIITTQEHLIDFTVNMSDLNSIRIRAQRRSDPSLLTNITSNINTYSFTDDKSL